MKIAAIAAMSQNRVIGKDNDLPWRLPEDMKRFHDLTTGGVVLMGRKNYESIPHKHRPLKKRRNIVITRNADWQAPEGVEVYASPEVAIEALREEGLEFLWIIGGGEIYKQTIPCWDEVYLTVIHKDYPGDVYFPEFEEGFVVDDTEEKDGFSYIHYSRE